MEGIVTEEYHEGSWYWVKFFNEWECAKYMGRDQWAFIEESVYYKSKLISVIGPRIELPEGLD